MTATTVIPYDAKDENWGIMTAQFITQLRKTQAMAERINAARLATTAGDTAANLEGAGTGWGVGSGAGSAFDTILGSVCGALTDANLSGWAARLDKGG